MNSAVFGFLALLCAVTMVYALATCQPRDPEFLAALVALVALGVLALLGARAKNDQRDEGFDDLDISKVARGLQAYYTLFSARSFARGEPAQREWASLVAERAPLRLPRAVAVTDPLTGLPEALVGPPSMGLGIDGAGPFTLFAVLAAATPTTPPVDLLRAFSSNLATSNNGISVQLEHVPTTTAQARVRVVFGNSAPLVSAGFTMTPGKPMLVCVSRSEASGLTVAVADVAASAGSGGDGGPAPSVVLQDARVALPESGIQLSNKECLVGGGGARLFAWGLFSEALSAARQADLAKHIFDCFRRLDPAFIEQQALQAQLDKTKACPLTVELCLKCAEVKDWSSALAVMTQAGAPCLQAVHTFCLQNPQHPGCVACYGAGGNDESASCKKLKSFLAPPPVQQRAPVQQPAPAPVPVPVPVPAQPSFAPASAQPKGFWEWLTTWGSDDHDA